MSSYPFENPSEKYRGLDLWMVNDKLEDDEIERQVNEFYKKGLYSVIFRTYNGLISDYPGENFKHKVRVAVNAAKKCGLKIFLQAGFMPSAYPALPKEYALHRIVPVPSEKLTDGQAVLCEYDGISFTDQIAPATVNMIDKEAVGYYLRTAYEEMWCDFTDEFGKTILGIWLDEPRFDNRYLTWSHDFESKFLGKYGYSIKDNLASLYHDVGDYKRIRYDYFTFIRDSMEEIYYSGVQNWCHAHNLSFAGHLMGEDYFTMQISQSVAAMPFYKYFDIPGVDMLRSCHDWYDKPLMVPDPKTRRQVERTLHLTPIQCTSAAEQAGKDLKLCEMYGVTSMGFGFRDMMHLFDFFAANGVNHQCMHALFYSPRGFRKRFYPQTFNVYQPFWENFRNVKDYVSAVSSFISMGKCSKEVVVLHPLETAYGLFRGLIDPNDTANRAAVDDYDNMYYRLLAQLYSSQIGFHLADPSTVDSLGGVKDSRFCVGKMSYDTLVLADIEVLTSKTLELIKGFAENGGRVCIKGELPSRLDGIYSTELGVTLRSLPGARIFKTNEELIRALKSECRKTWDYVSDTDSSQTVIEHREDGERHYFFVHNGDCRKEKNGEIVLSGLHKAYSFDAYTKEIKELYSYSENGKTKIPFTNPVGGSSMIFTSPDHAKINVAEPHKYSYSIPLRRVDCKIPEKNVLTLELCRYKTDKMTDFSEKAIAIERVVERLKREDYEGNVSLRFSFYSDFRPKGLKLVLEDAEEYSIRFNGKEISNESKEFYYSSAFKLVDLPDLTLIGENVIEITRYTKPQKALEPSDDMKHLFELFRAPVGVDMERIHLVGDFLVDTIPEYSATAGAVRLGKQFFIKEQKAITPATDVTSCGYPFYPGALEYTIKFKLTEKEMSCERILFKIGNYSGCTSAVYLNGEKAGFIDKDPYSLVLNKNLFTKSGENEIQVRLLGTFRNMLGYSHFVECDPSGCSRITWYFGYEFTDCTEYDTGNLTNSLQLTPYGLGSFSLELEMTEI